MPVARDGIGTMAKERSPPAASPEGSGLQPLLLPVTERRASSPTLRWCRYLIVVPVDGHRADIARIDRESRDQCEDHAGEHY